MDGQERIVEQAPEGSNTRIAEAPVAEVASRPLRKIEILEYLGWIEVTVVRKGDYVRVTEQDGTKVIQGWVVSEEYIHNGEISFDVEQEWTSDNTLRAV